MSTHAPTCTQAHTHTHKPVSNIFHFDHASALNKCNSSCWRACRCPVISSWPCPILLSLLLEEDRCRLYCKAENFEFFFAMSSKVKDGTPCSPNKNDVCIDGICEVREPFCFGMSDHVCVSSYQMANVRRVARKSVCRKAGGIGLRGNINPMT